MALDRARSTRNVVVWQLSRRVHAIAFSAAAGPVTGSRFAVARLWAMSGEDLAQRVALVTGGSGGIGAEFSLRLAGAGAAVGVHYRTNREAAERVVGKIADAGGQAAAFAADLRQSDAPELLVDLVEGRLGSVDELAANAGLSRPGSYEEIDAAAFDETLAVNLRAPYLLARHVLPGMRARGFGRILFTSSVAALTGGIVGPHYASSKAGLALAVIRNGYVSNQVVSIDGGIHPG